ncbi:MAG: hypothetical protein H6R19_1607 [Proteobacteria bacterium]|nr:hypothetical protein [Pseudomonadota bacterium]
MGKAEVGGDGAGGSKGEGAQQATTSFSNVGGGLSLCSELILQMIAFGLKA